MQIVVARPRRTLPADDSRHPAATPTLVNAAPDAYSVLLPDRAVRAMRPGAIGLVLLDAAQRAYEPGVRVRGWVVARLPNPVGFRRPNGDLDRSPAVVVDGVVGSSP